MTDLYLQLFFFQGTITYTTETKIRYATFTIDLIFTNTYLAEEKIVCACLNMDYGLDCSAIQTVFVLDTSGLPLMPPYRLFKSAS